MIRHLTLVLIAVLFAACFKGPSFLKKSGDYSNPTHVETDAGILSDKDGVLTAQFSSTSRAAQKMGASADSAIAGTSVVFPPGALAINASISIQEGVSLASGGLAGEIGIDPSNTVSAVAKTVVISTDIPMDASNPFTLSIPIGTSSLRLDAATANYAVLFSVFVAGEQKNTAGVIPLNLLTITNGFVSFSISHFGAYQLVETATPIVEKVEVATERKIVTKQEAATAPMALDNYAPYAVAAGKKVTLTGTNFRQTMTVALGSKTVSDLSVQSDTAATFIMPDSVGFGFTDIVIAQDGVVEKGKLFALANKTAYPLITIAETGVCSGVTYYDANGDKKVGTKDCGSGGSVNTSDFMLKSVFDANGNGKVDQADAATAAINATNAANAANATNAANAANAVSATSAASATNASAATFADWSTGRAGTPATHSGTGVLSLAGNGNFYVVSGSGTITGLSSAAEGTRISLKFSNVAPATITLRDSSGLVLNSINFAAKEGDIVEFQSLGSGVWRELSRSVRKSYVVASCGTCTQTFANENTWWSPVTPPTSLVFGSESTDLVGEFNGTVFTPVQSGIFEFKLDLKFLAASFPSWCSGGKTVSVGYYINGTQIGSSVSGTSCNSGERIVTDIRQFPVDAGQSLTVKAYYFDSAALGSLTAGFDSSYANLLSIRRID